MYDILMVYLYNIFYSQTGSHTAGHLGSSHFQAHYGWQWGSAYNFNAEIEINIRPKTKNFFIVNILRLLIFIIFKLKICTIFNYNYNKWHVMLVIKTKLYYI